MLLERPGPAGGLVGGAGFRRLHPALQDLPESLHLVGVRRGDVRQLHRVHGEAVELDGPGLDVEEELEALVADGAGQTLGRELVAVDGRAALDRGPQARALESGLRVGGRGRWQHLCGQRTRWSTTTSRPLRTYSMRWRRSKKVKS